MSTFLKELIAGGDFMPHGHCYFWKPAIVWLHVGADALITLAYYSIPLTLVYFIIRKRRDVPYPWMFLMFGGFIVACGTTHLLEIWSVWHGAYWLSGTVKAITALLSISTAILLVRLVPQAMLLQGPAEIQQLTDALESRVRHHTAALAHTNQMLRDEIAERQRAQERVGELNADLERRVKELQAVLDVLPVGVGIARDRECRDIRVNKAFARTLDIRTTDNASRTAPAGGGPAHFRVLSNGRELRPEELPMQVAAAQGIEVRDAEEAIEFTSGRTLHLLGYAAPLYDEANRVCGSVGAFVDITNHRRAEQRFRLAVEASPSATVMVSPDGRIVLVNSQTETLFGYPRAELIGQSMEMLVPTRFRTQHPEFRAAFFRAPGVRRMGAGRDLFALRKDGSEFPVEIGLNPIETDEGVMVLSAIVDITERKRAEALIRVSLREKDVLLQEIHHRVKNNLQVISSLLRLQAATLRSPDAIAAFENSGSRVQSMALVHEMLYQSSSLSELDFAAYTRSLTESLLRAFGADPAVVRLTVDMERVRLDINQAIPCALILNELVTNALKYAFPHGRRGEIGLRLVCGPDRTAHLTVRDDGVGLPPGLDPERTGSLGLQLVKTLVRQLRGTITFGRAAGLECSITFTLAEPRGAEAPP